MHIYIYIYILFYFHDYFYILGSMKKKTNNAISGEKKLYKKRKDQKIHTA